MKITQIFFCGCEVLHTLISSKVASSETFSLTIHENSIDKFDISFIQVPTALCITEDGFCQLSKVLKADNKRQDANFAFLGNLHLFHLSNLSRLKGGENNP